MKDHRTSEDDAAHQNECPGNPDANPAGRKSCSDAEDEDHPREDSRSDSINGFTVTQRHLPHWEEPGRAYFITFTLKDPTTCDLARCEFAPIVIEALHYYAGRRYWLYEYTVMPDHVHAIIQPIPVGGVCEALWRIMQNLKSWTARQINQRLGWSGPVWLDETYDHMVRNPRDHQQKARYIWLNPVEEGLVRNPADWPWWGNGEGQSRSTRRDPQ